MPAQTRASRAFAAEQRVDDGGAEKAAVRARDTLAIEQEKEHRVEEVELFFDTEAPAVRVWVELKRALSLVKVARGQGRVVQVGGADER